MTKKEILLDQTINAFLDIIIHKDDLPLNALKDLLEVELLKFMIKAREL